MLSVIGAICFGLACLGWICFFFIALRVWQNWKMVFRPIETGSAPKSWPRVSVVVPARNEKAEIGRALESLAKQNYPDLEIIVVDDGSTDSTVAIVQALADRDDRIRLLTAPPVPEGWLGKCHALQIGAAASTGEWILFTDADVRHATDSVRTAVTCAESQRLDHLGLAPRLEARGPWEEIVLPFVFFLMAAAMPRGRFDDKTGDLAMGAGAFNLVRASVYRAVGGHERIRRAVIDDIMLAVLFKSRGHASGWRDGRHLLRVRMYDGLRSIVTGLRKNLYAASKGQSGLLPLSALATTYAIPLPVATAGALCGGGWPATTAALMALGLYLANSLILPLRQAFVEHRRRWGFAHPAAACVLIGIFLRSAYDGMVRGEVHWRGRTYRWEPQAIAPESILPLEKDEG